MKVFRSIVEFSAYRDSLRKGDLGLVETMGYLHKGHESLIRAAREQNKIVLVTIFVNPIQFSDPKDFETYPRDEEGDLKKCESWGVDIALLPTVAEVYPHGFGTFVESEFGSAMHNKWSEGHSMPNFFRGVSTILLKMINIVHPQRAYFGEKDAQRCVVAKTLVRDLNIRVQIVTLPVVRDVDGLALTARAAFLSPEQRKKALVLQRSLNDCIESFNHGLCDAESLRVVVHDMAENEPDFLLDYVSVADPETMYELEGEVRAAMVTIAGKIGTTRLIDCCSLKV